MASCPYRLLCIWCSLTTKRGALSFPVQLAIAVRSYEHPPSSFSYMFCISSDIGKILLTCWYIQYLLLLQVKSVIKCVRQFAKSGYQLLLHVWVSVWPPHFKWLDSRELDRFSWNCKFWGVLLKSFGKNSGLVKRRTKMTGTLPMYLISLCNLRGT